MTIRPKSKGHDTCIPFACTRVAGTGGPGARRGGTAALRSQHPVRAGSPPWRNGLRFWAGVVQCR